MWALGIEHVTERRAVAFVTSAITDLPTHLPTLRFQFCRLFKVSATLKIAIFPYLRFQRFQIDMLESFLLKQKSEENIISVERYRG